MNDPEPNSWYNFSRDDFFMALVTANAGFYWTDSILLEID